MPRLSAQEEIDKRKKEQNWFRNDLDIQMIQKMQRIDADQSFVEQHYVLQ